MRNHVRFRSEAFAPSHAEAAETNPGRYGFELATWLVARLRLGGVTVAEPFAEDWGWMMRAEHLGQPLSIACGNVDGSLDEWLVWVEAERPGFVRRMLGGGQRPSGDDGLASLVMRLDAFLRDDPSISSIEWFRTASDMSEVDHADHP